MNAILTIGAGVVAALADWLLVRWAAVEDESALGLAPALGIYVAALVIFAYSLRTGTLLVNGAMFVIVNGLGALAISRLVLHEPVTPRQWVGLGLGVLAIVLLEA